MEHKYKIRVNEIMFTKFHEKRLATLESVLALQGKVLSETSELLFFGGSREAVSINEGESREAFLERKFEPRHRDISAALLGLHEAREAGFIYLPETVYERLSDFHKATVELVQTYTLRMMEPRQEPAFYETLSDDAIARYRVLEAERLEIVRQVRAYLENNEQG